MNDSFDTTMYVFLEVLTCCPGVLHSAGMVPRGAISAIPHVIGMARRGVSSFVGCGLIYMGTGRLRLHKGSFKEDGQNEVPQRLHCRPNV